MAANNQREFEYDAFISYRHAEPDKTIAKKLRVALERYSAPLGTSKNGIRKIKKVFMDRDELPATDNLEDSIMYALQNSRYLIVVCSPSVRQKPQWIENEIKYFTKFRGRQYIQTLLIEGEPEEAFPDSLLFETIEIVSADGTIGEEQRNLEFLAADVRPEELKREDREARLHYGISKDTDGRLLKKALRLLKTEKLRCLAPMFGCKFDDLYRRHMRRAIQNTLLGGLAVVLLLGSFLAYAINMNTQLAHQVEETLKQQQEAERQAGIAADNEKEAVKNAEEAVKNAEEAAKQQQEAEKQANLAKINEEKAQASSEEAIKQKTEAERQAEIAGINEEEAKRQAEIAGINAAEAERQSKIAGINEAKAIANAEEATRQQLEAEKQRENADRQAAIATTERNLTLASQSLFLADLSSQQLNEGDRLTAVMLALEALPKKPDFSDRPYVIEAEEALRNAVQRTYDDFIPQQHIRANSYFITVDMSKDKTKLLTTSADSNYACLWDAASGNLIRTLNDHDEQMPIAKFSPDGSKIVTGTWFYTELWDTETGEKLFDFDVLNLGVLRNETVNFSPDGKMLVVFNSVYDLKTGELLYQLDQGKRGLVSVKFNPDSTKLVTAMEDGSIILWNAKNGEQISIMTGHSKYVNLAIFSPDGKKILSVSDDETAIVWETDSAKLLYRLEGHTSEIKSGSFDSWGNRVLTISFSEAILWDANTGERLHSYKIAGGIHNGAALYPNNNSVITASGDCQVWMDYADRLKCSLADYNTDQSYQYYNQVIVSADGKTLVVLSGKDIRVWQLTSKIFYKAQGERYTIWDISPDSNKMIGINLRNAIIWDAKTGEPLTTLSDNTYINEAWFSPDGNKIVTDHGKNLVLWDAATGKQLTTITSNNYIGFLQFSPDSTKILIQYSTSGNNTVIRDASSGKFICRLSTGYITTACFSRDGTKVVTAERYKRKASIWDVQTGELLVELKGQEENMENAEFNADGTRVVTFSDYRTATVWNSITGEALFQLKGHLGMLCSASFSPDGKKIVTSSWDETAIIWDAQTGELLTRLEEYNNIIVSARFSPDGKLVVTASDSGSVVVWDVTTGKTLSEYQVDIGVMKSASFSPDGTGIIISSKENGCSFVDYKPLSQVLEDARALLQGHIITEVEKEIFYLE